MTSGKRNVVLMGKSTRSLAARAAACQPRFNKGRSQLAISSSFPTSVWTQLSAKLRLAVGVKWKSRPGSLCQFQRRDAAATLFASQNSLAKRISALVADSHSRPRNPLAYVPPECALFKLLHQTNLQTAALWRQRPRAVREHQLGRRRLINADLLQNHVQSILGKPELPFPVHILQLDGGHTHAVGIEDVRGLYRRVCDGDRHIKI